jgi:glutamate-5-semialdehyde dehydrogenase
LKVRREMNILHKQCQKIKRASKSLAISSSRLRNQLLISMARILNQNSKALLEANELDLANGRNNGLSEAMLDRLRISADIIKQMQDSLIDVSKLDDPLKSEEQSIARPNGLKVSKKSIPLGVILMIYESRPNVTVEAAALAVKSGNAIILRGGKEAFQSNQAIARCWKQALSENALDEAVITILKTTEKKVMNDLLKLDDCIDVVIPRGGEGLIRYVVENSFIPVIKHYKGVCHLYIDETANINTGINILLNGKTQRPGVCNAIEGLVIHQAIATKFLPLAQSRLEGVGVQLYGCEVTRQTLPSIELASELEFETEFLDLKLSIKVVTDIEQAINFIDRYGSNHTEVIVTQNEDNAEKFVNEIDASVVMVNASSRFSDGGELGLGAEIGISTSKIHAYGPMGLKSLTSEKFVVLGQGQIRG